MKTERRCLTQPADHWAAFDAQAHSEGYTLSEWADLCMQAHLTTEAAAGLSDRPPAHRPKAKKPLQQ